MKHHLPVLVDDAESDSIRDCSLHDRGKPRSQHRNPSGGAGFLSNDREALSGIGRCYRVHKSQRSRVAELPAIAGQRLLEVISIFDSYQRRNITVSGKFYPLPAVAVGPEHGIEIGVPSEAFAKPLN